MDKPNSKTNFNSKNKQITHPKQNQSKIKKYQIDNNKHNKYKRVILL